MIQDVGNIELWDALSDEDLITSNHCPPCNDYNKKQEKNHTCPLILTSTNNGSWQSSSSTWWNWQGSWWSSYNSESQEGSGPSPEWTGTRFLQYLARIFETGFHEFNFFCYSWIVNSWRRSTVTDEVCKDNTSNDPFSRCKCATIWLQMKLTIIEYSLTTSAYVDDKIQKKRTLHLVLRLHGETEHDTNDNVTINCIASAWRNRARHQWQRDHQDPEHLPHSAHEPQHVNDARLIPCAHGPRVNFLSSWLHTTSWLKFHLCASSHGRHMMSLSLRPWVLHSLLLPHLLIHLQSLALPPALLPQPWGQ